MRPGIGRNVSCASGDWLTSRPKGCSQPRELWFFDIELDTNTCCSRLERIKLHLDANVLQLHVHVNVCNIHVLGIRMSYTLKANIVSIRVYTHTVRTLCTCTCIVYITVAQSSKALLWGTIPMYSTHSYNCKR